ncbi:TPM domain-containing protein [Pseudotabrizicola algicola]|uniref:TPM domain-containing protein n=1 Tax=Pseudotabrizicola algicola TaxID=2709381 RepID=A0A6B3RGB0_9RHOB|nr:TPM domain-containing protein [Pseudotabrizicola algicola]NEX45040.1 TPM domain-containing protein [Pseudotabrizicola algicola]
MLRVLFLALCLFLAPGLAAAQPYPDPLGDTLSDYAGLLPPEAQLRLSETLAKGRAETGVHVVLVIMNRLADHGGAGARIEDYAKALFNRWGVGDAARDDGILILIARDDREMRIALGAGYEVIWDNAAQRVIDRSFLPAFRNDDYVGGIEAGVAATFDLIARPFAAGAETPPAPPFDWQAITPFLIFGGAILGFIALVARAVIGDALVRLRACPSCGARSLSRRRDVTLAASTARAGHGILHTRCAACGYDRSEPYSIAKISRGSGSSGGFGGGSSSGGGATGRW